MRWLSAYDLPSRFGRAPAWLVQALVAGVIIALATGARLFVDRFAQGVVAFPLVFPALAMATLLAGGRCGLMVVVGCQILAWYYLVPVRGSFAFASADDAISLGLSTAGQLLLLWLVASYRKSEREAGLQQRAHSEELTRVNALLRERADISEQNLQRQKELRASRQNLEAIYQASGDGLALCEAIWDDEGHVADYQVLEVNHAHAELTAATREQMLGQPVSAIYPPADRRWFEAAEEVLKTGLMHNFDIRSRATGRWLNIRTSRVSDNLFQQTFVDVSDRHRLEEQRRALLKEMSHRVMNNFQVVAGFLRLQARTVDTAAKPHLQAAENRVHVLAKLHSLLAYAESDSDIDAAAYVKELCGYLRSAIERPDAVTLVCQAGELRLPMETVVPLGFVITELVTNAAKYAFPPPMTGAIHVSLAPRAAGWVLVIRDSGQGLKAEPGEEGLGSGLVRRFVQQMGARLVTTSDGGVRHEIRFEAT